MSYAKWFDDSAKWAGEKLAIKEVSAGRSVPKEHASLLWFQFCLVQPKIDETFLVELEDKQVDNNIVYLIATKTVDDIITNLFSHRISDGRFNFLRWSPLVLPAWPRPSR